VRRHAATHARTSSSASITVIVAPKRSGGPGATKPFMGHLALITSSCIAFGPVRSPVCRHLKWSPLADAHVRCYRVNLQAPSYNRSAPPEDALPWSQVRCPEGGQNTPDASGGWRLNDAYTYKLDRMLVNEYVRIFDGATVTELGAGKGCYTAALLASGRVRSVKAFDGALNIHQLTGGLVEFADLSTGSPLVPSSHARSSSEAPANARPEGSREGTSDWVLSTEVGEHIPSRSEALYIDHVASHARIGAILSWGIPEQSGIGHVNLLTNEQVAARMSVRGLCLDVRDSVRLRRAAYGGVHFRSTISVYRRRCTAQHAPCCWGEGARSWALATIMSTLEDLALQPWQRTKPRHQRRRRAACLLVLSLFLLLASCAIALVWCRRARSSRHHAVGYERN
jgi:hypothetical protein